MSSAAPPDATRLRRAEPQLFVSDLARALAFFRERLGFAVGFAWGEPPFYAQVVRDEARLNLREVEPPVLAPGFREREPDALAAVIVVDDVAALFSAMAPLAGPFLHQPLREEPWGALTFVVRDPDGNLLLFAGPGGE